ncbi:BTAD domain-containing putative transcriptional regulator [Streptomyces rimosus]|uniref:BTAD domain-containing putative transcriptional regulator n=1 Tax=Streptomyces rimosus TaxID=1927 RepID=UPI00067E4A66|nr:BTAD domain-containing putative transcriptional regulator [Streptomyces rimosus]
MRRHAACSRPPLWWRPVGLVGRMISSGMMVTVLLSIPWGVWQALAVCLVSMVLLAPPGRLVGRQQMVAPPARAASAVVRAVDEHATASAVDQWPDDTAAAGRSVTVTVRSPCHGVYDSLWRIAARELGDGRRWPQIYDRNVGRPQPDGGALRHPDLIQPGWVLRLPPRRTSPNVPPSHPRPSPSTPAPTSPGPDPSVQPRPAPSGDDGFPGGAVLGLVLAAVVAALAALRARRRSRARHRKRPRRRKGGVPGPVVRALPPVGRYAPPPAGAPPEEPTVAGEPPAGHGAAAPDGRWAAWQLARCGGLGLVGPGAVAAVRALLLARMAEPSETARMLLVVPQDDAALLFGTARAALAQAPGVRLAAGLDAALDVAEAAGEHRGPSGSTCAGLDEPVEVVLVATPAPYAVPRLRTASTLPAARGRAVLLLGSWGRGGTVRVQPDGTVSAAFPAAAQQLTGTRLFTRPEPDAATLAAALHSSRPAPPRSEPPSSDTPTPAVGPLPQKAAPAAPMPEQAVLELSVLGRIVLVHRRHGHAREITDVTTPKQREVLAFLALHRQGASREAIAAALWPEAPSARPYNTFHATLSQLRRALRQATEDTVGFDGLVLHRDGRYVLDARRVHVDLWALRDQLDRTGATVPANWTALEETLACYRGDFAQEVTGVWPEGPREELRREVLDAYGLLVQAAHAHDPAHALALLERVRPLDPYNEALYRDIARTQARLGRPETISRTLALLTTSLAEIGEEPSPETVALCTALARHAGPQR